MWKLFKNIQSEGGGFKITVTYDNAHGQVALNGSNMSEITVNEDEPLDTAGVTLYRGPDHEIDLRRQGVHIVRVAGMTFKVMLK